MGRLRVKIAVLFFALFVLGIHPCLTVKAELISAAGKTGRIVYIDNLKDFVVINLGSADGIEDGAVFEVYRKDIKIGMVRAAKLRNRFSAADIEYEYKSKAFKIGDEIRLAPQRKDIALGLRDRAISRELEEPFAQAQDYVRERNYNQAESVMSEVARLDPENQMALEALDKIAQAAHQKKLNDLFAQAEGYIAQTQHRQAKGVVYEILNLEPENRRAKKMLDEIEDVLTEAVSFVEPGVVTVDINASKAEILPIVIEVFDKYGCFITFSDSLSYSLKASKDINLPWVEAMLSEGDGYKRNKVYYEVKVEDCPNQDLAPNRLVIEIKTAYGQAGREFAYQLERGSAVHKEAQKIALVIKGIAERI